MRGFFQLSNEFIKIRKRNLLTLEGSGFNPLEMESSDGKLCQQSLPRVRPGEKNTLKTPGQKAFSLVDGAVAREEGSCTQSLTATQKHQLGGHFSPEDGEGKHMHEFSKDLDEDMKPLYNEIPRGC